jgi:hypothetical protein
MKVKQLKELLADQKDDSDVRFTVNIVGETVELAIIEDVCGYPAKKVAFNFKTEKA